MPVEPVKAKRGPVKAIAYIGPFHDEVMPVFFLLRVDDVNLAMAPKHSQVTINDISRHAQFGAESMALEPADKPARGAPLVLRLRVDDDFHFTCTSVTSRE